MLIAASEISKQVIEARNVHDEDMGEPPVAAQAAVLLHDLDASSSSVCKWPFMSDCARPSKTISTD